MNKYKLEQMSPQEKALVKLWDKYGLEPPDRYRNDSYMRWYGEATRWVDVPDQPYHVRKLHLFDEVLAALSPQLKLRKRGGTDAK